MSTENAGPGNPGALEERVKSLQGQVAALESALAATRSTRLILLAGVIVLIGGIGSLFWSLAQHVRSAEYQRELTAAAQRHLEANGDAYMKQMQLFVDETTPVVSQAFLEQTKKDAPLYAQAINKERAALLENLQKRLEGQVNARFKSALDQYEKTLVQEFPQAADEKVRRRMMENFQIALEKEVRRYYVDEFRQELQAMYDAWDGFPVADAPGKDEPRLEDQLIGSLLDLMVVKAARSSGVSLASGEARAAPAAAAESASTAQPPAEPASAGAKN